MTSVAGNSIAADSTLVQEQAADRLPRHVAIIMDGNGRWARQRGLNRVDGHRRGVETVRRIVRHAGNLGIRYLTLFAFSSENWTRPRSEVRQLMLLLKRFVRRDLASLHEAGVRVRIIGRREGLEPQILQLINDTERQTADNHTSELLIAFNYGSRDEIVRAVRRIAVKVAAGDIAPEQIDADLISNHLDTAGIIAPDLLIRTSGELRLSNFLLWQSAYTEFVFSDCLWPDFSEADFDAALDAFARRKRRFGGIGAEEMA